MKASPRKTGRKRSQTRPARSGQTQVTALNVNLQWQTNLADYVTATTWSPDGQWFGAASAAGEIVLYPVGKAFQDSDRQHNRSLETPEPASRLLRAADGQAISALSFSADGHFVAAAGQAGTVWVWPIAPDLKTPPPAPMEQHHPGTWINCLSWHPQQHQVAYGSGAQAIVWDVVHHTQVELAFHDSSVLHLAWQPQGQFLTVSGHGGMKVWNQDDWTLPPQSVAVPGASLEGAWSPDGRYLASGNLDRTLTVMAWDSPPPWLMQGFPGKVRHLAWSPSSNPSAPQLAAACAEGITMWERRGKQTWTSRVLQHHEATVEAIAFQPHGQALASASQDGHVALWQRSNRPTHILEGFSQGASRLSWSSCGTRLAAGGSAGELFLWKIVVRQKARQKARQKKGFG